MQAGQECRQHPWADPNHERLPQAIIFKVPHLLASIQLDREDGRER